MIYVTVRLEVYRVLEEGDEFISLFLLFVLILPPPPLFSLIRLIKHTKQLLEENEERLCIKVLQTLREMMSKDRGYGEKVCSSFIPVSHSLVLVLPKILPHTS